MTHLRLNVVAGQNRLVVGAIIATVGMLTSAGRIARVTARTVYFANGVSRRNLDGITCRHSEAMRFGYPTSKGCARIATRYIRRGGQTIAA